MFPGMPKIDPRKMQQMMKQLGINQEEIEANRVIIEKTDGKIIIDNPSIQKIIMQDQESWQISGQSREVKENLQEDIQLIMEKTGKTEKEAKKALEENNGDIAEAIMSLS